MKKQILSAMTFLMIGGQALAFTCQSRDYGIILEFDGLDVVGNYSIKNKINDGADVMVEQVYSSDRIIAASLNVDGVPAKFELSVTKQKDGKFAGTIFKDKIAQPATCSN